jgi:hypothetical protein
MSAAVAISAIPGCKYVIGWDIGSRNDFSVGVVLDLTEERIDVANYVRIKDDYAAGIDVPKLERLKNATRGPRNVRFEPRVSKRPLPADRGHSTAQCHQNVTAQCHLSRFPGRRRLSHQGSDRPAQLPSSSPCKPSRFRLNDTVFFGRSDLAYAEARPRHASPSNGATVAAVTPKRRPFVKARASFRSQRS